MLGHIQRGGTPTAFDRVLATRLGLAAIDAANAGRWGTMPALRGTRIELVPLSEAVAELRTVPAEDYGRGRGVLRLEGRQPALEAAGGVLTRGRRAAQQPGPRTA